MKPLNRRRRGLHRADQVLLHPQARKLAECELHCTTRLCLKDRRIGELSDLQAGLEAWSIKIKAKQRGGNWQFKLEKARIKLERLNPPIKT